MNAKCPACDRPLRVRSGDWTKTVYCGAGRCPSVKANEGIIGSRQEETESLARQLITRLEADPDWED
jgi:hypothetical protein